MIEVEYMDTKRKIGIVVNQKSNLFSITCTRIFIEITRNRNKYVKKQTNKPELHRCMAYLMFLSLAAIQILSLCPDSRWASNRFHLWHQAPIVWLRHFRLETVEEPFLCVCVF